MFTRQCHESGFLRVHICAHIKSADVLLTDDSYSDCSLYVQIAAIVAEKFHQAVCANARAAAEELRGGLSHWYITAFLPMQGDKLTSKMVVILR